MPGPYDASLLFRSTGGSKRLEQLLRVQGLGPMVPGLGLFRISCYHAGGARGPHVLRTCCYSTPQRNIFTCRTGPVSGKRHIGKPALVYCRPK